MRIFIYNDKSRGLPGTKLYFVKAGSVKQAYAFLKKEYPRSTWQFVSSFNVENYSDSVAVVDYILVENEN